MLKKFRRIGRVITKEPSIFISEAGFSINRAALRRYFSDKSHVELYYDSEKKLIGLMPQSQTGDDTFPVRVYRSGSPTGRVSAKRFIRENKIMGVLAQTGRRSFKIEEDENGMLLLFLKKTK
jgi:hypothetical protein